VVTEAFGVDSTGKAYVEVTVAYTFNTLTGFPGIPNQINLTRTVRMGISASTPSTN
jgi:hypothetical protein